MRSTAPRHRSTDSVVTIYDVRELALSLPRSYEVLVRDRVKFRVGRIRSEEHTSELQSHSDLVCRLLRARQNSSSAMPTKHRNARESASRQATPRAAPTPSKYPLSTARK